jgi:putative heme-binding domain-containing protein
VSEEAAVAAVKFRALFPHRDTRHGDARVDREILRTLALLGLEAPASLPRRWDKSLNPVDDIHELAVWARCANKDRATAHVAATLLDLDAKIALAKLNRDSHWPLRVAELYAGLVEKDGQLAVAIVNHPRFGRADHALFVPTSGELRAQAARAFLTRLEKDADFEVSEGVLQLLHSLPASEVIPVARPLWGTAGHDAGVLALLARQPEAVDRAKFVHGLGSPQLYTVSLSFKALDALPLQKNAQEVFALIRVLGQLTEKNVELRAAAARRLAEQTGLPANSPPAAWTEWLLKHDAKLAQRLTNPDGVDVAAWNKRAQAIDWSAGDAGRGRAVFTKANCAACHSGNQAIGPDLKGVTKRFSRGDLLTTLIQPSRDVPARYQLTQVETRAGKFYEGVVIYDAVDSLILHTGAAVTVRLAGEEVAARRPVARSLMPAGLLDGLTDEEIADLFAYLAANN